MANDSETVSARDGASVRRRHVLYAHGFDPAKSDRYRRLILRAGEDRANLSTHMGDVAKITDLSEGWTIYTTRSSANGGGPETQVETTFEILRYEDVVRAWRNRPLLQRLSTGVGSWARFAFLGGLWRTFFMAKGPVFLFFYPVAMLYLFARLGMEALGFIGQLAEDHLAAPDGAALTLTLLGVIFGIWISLRVERALFVHLMLALFDFLIRIAEGRSPTKPLNTRIDAFADRITDAIQKAEADGADEVLIVGHSLGGLVAVRAIAAALEKRPDLTAGRAAVSLLTLGSVGGYVACRGGLGAEAYDASVIRVAQDQNLHWVDISAPRDWFSFGLVDPLLMTSAPPPTARSPRVFSAKFGKYQPDPEDRRTRFRAMGLHMRYLGKPDQKGGFDFFECVVGGQTLEARFAARRNSPKAKMLGW